jgi:hypothetical protein
VSICGLAHKYSPRELRPNGVLRSSCKGASRRAATTPILVHIVRARSCLRREEAIAAFAIIITLLVLEIGRPEVGHGELGSELLHRWPEYLAFAVSVHLHRGDLAQPPRPVRRHPQGRRRAQLDQPRDSGDLGPCSLPDGRSGLGAERRATRRSARGGGAVRDRGRADVGGLGAVFPYLHRRPGLLVDPSEVRLFRAQRSRPWVGVVSFGAAAILGYLFGPVFAIPLFVWMIAYHAATSEGLHANRIARLFSSVHLSHAARTEDKAVDPRSGASEAGDSDGRSTHDPDNHGSS